MAQSFILRRNYLSDRRVVHMEKGMTGISRRDFVALTAAGAVATPFILGNALVHGATVTAQEIVDRVKKNIGVDWGSDDVDTFKAGDPSTIITGVVTTSMATLDVLQKAVQAGANFVITAAPTFYSKADLSTPGGPGAGAGGPGTGASAPMPPAPAMPGSVVPPRPPAAAAAPATPPPPDPVYAGKN